jgi:hypothetical protein
MYDSWKDGFRYDCKSSTQILLFEILPFKTQAFSSLFGTNWSTRSHYIPFFLQYYIMYI